MWFENLNKSVFYGIGFYILRCFVWIIGYEIEISESLCIYMYIWIIFFIFIIMIFRGFFNFCVCSFYNDGVLKFSVKEKDI